MTLEDKLIDATIDQVKEDLANCDVTSLWQLLNNVPTEFLMSFLSIEKKEKLVEDLANEAESKETAAKLEWMEEGVGGRKLSGRGQRLYAEIRDIDDIIEAIEKTM